MCWRVPTTCPRRTSHTHLKKERNTLGRERGVNLSYYNALLALFGSYSALCIDVWDDEIIYSLPQIRNLDITFSHCVLFDAKIRVKTLGGIISYHATQHFTLL